MALFMGWRPAESLEAKKCPFCGHELVKKIDRVEGRKFVYLHCVKCLVNHPVDCVK